MKCAIVLLACLLASPAALAKTGVVKTTQGQSYDGDIVDNPDDSFVTITVRGIATRVNRSDIASVNTDSTDEDYKTQLANLDPKDAKGRLALARWAFNRKRYDLARDAADKALEAEPNSAEATQFLNLILYQQRLERSHDKAVAHAADGDKAAAPSHPATTTIADRNYVSAADINRIRQEELRRVDDRARVVFRNDVERRFVDSTKYTLPTFRGMSPARRAMTILDEGDPSLRADVSITTDPMSIQEFRRFVQPLVLQNCATAGCHGGANAGPLVLFPNADNSEPATYSNFYILQTYGQKSDRRTGAAESPVFGAPDVRKLIDRLDPESSLLLQYGLPRALTKTPHPDVPDLRPAFKGRESPKYRALLAWIANSLRPGESHYDINYVPPTAATATPAADGTSAAPATEPVRSR